MANRVRLLIVSLAVALVVSAQAQAESGPQLHDEMMTWQNEVFLLSEVLEYVPLGSERPLRYDLVGWVGGDVSRIWAKADGTQSTENGTGETELQLLYGRLVSPFWDAQVGLRLDVGYGAGDSQVRVLGALGLQGLAPGWFEVEPTIFVSQDGDVSAGLTASYDSFITQRLVAQARVEGAAALQAVPEFGIGSGVNEVDLALRLRYELIRQVAPYIGVGWRRLLMESADYARASGENVSELSVVAGLRLWY